MSIDAVMSGLAALTLFGAVLAVLLPVLLFAPKLIARPVLVRTAALIGRFGLPAAFIVTLTATLGSLYFSEIAAWVPCKLCWFQRVFMYPQPLILAVAMIARDRSVWRYVLPLCVIGAAFSAYHYSLQLNPPAVTFCSLDAGESCAQTPFMYYGFITIPVMALAASVLSAILVLAARRPSAVVQSPRVPAA